MPKNIDAITDKIIKIYNDKEIVYHRQPHDEIIQTAAEAANIYIGLVLQIDGLLGTTSDLEELAKTNAERVVHSIETYGTYNFVFSSETQSLYKAWQAYDMATYEQSEKPEDTETNKKVKSTHRKLARLRNAMIKQLQEAILRVLQTQEEQDETKSTENTYNIKELPTKFIAPNHKAINSLQRIPTSSVSDKGLKINLSISKKKSKLTPMIISLAPGLETENHCVLSWYDRTVFNAACSFLNSNPMPCNLTPGTLYRIMNDTKAQPSKIQEERIIKSMDDMSRIRTKLDLTDQYEEWKKTPQRLKSFTIESNLLSTTKVEMITENGNTVTGYRIHEIPPLFACSADLGQLMQTDPHLLSIKQPNKNGEYTKNASNTELLITIRSYLLWRIGMMQNKKNKSADSKIIRLTNYQKDGTTHYGLYSIAGLKEESSTDKEKRSVRQTVEKILNYWQHYGWIQGYLKTTSSGTLQPNETTRKEITGYEILIEKTITTGEKK